MYVRKFMITFVMCYSIIWVNQVDPCIGEVFVNASVTVDGDTAILTLTASVNGTFHCKLDVGSFHTCYSGGTYNNLSAGLHSIAVQFTPDGSSQVIFLPSPLNFNIFLATVCKNPGNPPNGSFNVLFENSKTWDVGTVIQYTCHRGFRPVGSIERVCQPNGEWNGTMPVCLPICQNCGSPGIPSHGSVTLYNTTAGCEAVFGCDSGYRLVGNATLVCQPNGKWSEMEPTCQRIDCGNPDQLSNGTTTFVDTFFNSLVLYQCNYGFTLVGNNLHLCDATGTWSGVSPSCQPVDCGPPPIPTNTSAVYTTTFVDSTVAFFCNSSHISHVLCASGICFPSGSWVVQSCISTVVNMSHTAYFVTEDNSHVRITVILDHPRCITTVGTVVPQRQTPVDAARSDFDSTPITFEISPGNTSTYVFISITNNRRVEKNESFDVVLQSNGDGVIVGTPRLATVTIIDDDAISVSFRQPLYAMQDRRVKVCLTKAGRHDFPISVVLHHLSPEGSIISRNSLKFKAGRSSLCYRQSAVGSKNLTSFNITIVPSKLVRIGNYGSTRIVIRCEVPGKPANGMHSFQSTAIGSTITYSCDDGFKLVGDKSQNCLDTGLWSGSVPACNCGVEGQQYLGCVGNITDCELTCDDDPDNLNFEFCLFCQKCRCPSGTVLDKIAKRCVKINECSKNS